MMKTSYSAWLLLVVNSNFNACSIIMSPNPSSTIPAPLPFTLKVSSTDNDHSEGGSSSMGELSLATKLAMAYNLMLPFGMYWMLYSESSTGYDIVLRVKSGFFNACRTCS